MLGLLAGYTRLHIQFNIMCHTRPRPKPLDFLKRFLDAEVTSHARVVRLCQQQRSDFVVMRYDNHTIGIYNQPILHNSVMFSKARGGPFATREVRVGEEVTIGRRGWEVFVLGRIRCGEVERGERHWWRKMGVLLV